jgi:undecaprenyl pyrophosphate phosphatase UppP
VEKNSSTGETMKKLGGSLFTAKGLAMRALLIGVVYVACELAGWREYTSVLCGTSPTGATIDRLMALRASLYLLAYFGCVLGVPVLLIGAGLLALLKRRAG